MLNNIFSDQRSHIALCDEGLSAALSPHNAECLLSGITREYQYFIGLLDCCFGLSVKPDIELHPFSFDISNGQIFIQVKAKTTAFE